MIDTLIAGIYIYDDIFFYYRILKNFKKIIYYYYKKEIQMTNNFKLNVENGNWNDEILMKI